MSLRRRLWLVLGGLFLVPLAVGALVLLLVVPDARSARVSDLVVASEVAVRAELTNQCVLLGLVGQVVAYGSATGDPATVAGNLIDLGFVDYVVVIDADGSPLASAGELPPGAGPLSSLPGCSQDTGAASSDSSAGSAPGLIVERVPVTGATGGNRTVVVARRLDADLLSRIQARIAVDSEVVLLRGTAVVGSTLGPQATRVLVAAIAGRSGLVEVEGWTAQVDPPGGGVSYTTVVASADASDSTVFGLFGVILLAAAVVAGFLVTTVARGLSQPYTAITEAAERVARGDLDTPIAAASDGEAGRLGSAVTQMTGELRRSMLELERSRQDLRDSLERIGDTLTSTHDRDGLLQVVLETAVVTLQGRAGVVLHLSADRLELVAEHDLADSGLAVPLDVTPGTGVLGRVVSTGESVRGVLGSGPAPLRPAGNEPAEGEVLAVPVRSMGRVIGVVALYGRVDGRSFDSADEDALRTLVGQASIAVDNVHLHHEAQRLSTTDPLTGLWNFRYLSMSLAREIERSTRFDRPLAVLMLDLDHFKAVNDTYGHARGDSVLRELARRVQEQIREVDVFARYGGEEFVVVLPETTVDGAALLAERICEAVRRQPFNDEGEEPIAVTLSIGGAAFPQHGSSAATLMRAADRALYVAKDGGRDGWQVPGAHDGAVTAG